MGHVVARSSLNSKKYLTGTSGKHLNALDTWITVIWAENVPNCGKNGNYAQIGALLKPLEALIRSYRGHKHLKYIPAPIT